MLEMPDKPVQCSQLGKLSFKYGLRTVAIFEAIKGVAVIALCVVLLSLLHKDLDAVVDHLTHWLRLNPDSRLADWFYDLADRTTGRGIWAAVTVGLAYSCCRFVEAYGLWHERQWAEWFAVISGAMFVPAEVIAIIAHPHPARFVVLVCNILIVLFVLGILLATRRQRSELEAKAHKSGDG
jgi:uncharacterized membrane protein (DUF2068 family)